MKTPTTHYAVLELAEHASPEAIRGAYRHLAQKWHPDKNPTNKIEATRITSLLNEAYAVLSDPTQKEEYDKQLSDKRDSHRQGTEAPPAATSNVNAEQPPHPSPKRSPPLLVKKRGSAIKGAAWGSLCGIVGFFLLAISTGSKSQFQFDLPSFAFFIVTGALIGAWGLRR